MKNEKSKAELLKEKLFINNKNAYEVCDKKEIKNNIYIVNTLKQ